MNNEALLMQFDSLMNDYLVAKSCGGADVDFLAGKVIGFMTGCAVFIHNDTLDYFLSEAEQIYLIK